MLLALAGLNRGLVFLMAGYDSQPASGPLLLFGTLAAAVAIIGIYSRTRERSPTLAKVAGGFAALSVVTFRIFFTLGYCQQNRPFAWGSGPTRHSRDSFIHGRYHTRRCDCNPILDLSRPRRIPADW